jgi:hypothetical protein
MPSLVAKRSAPTTASEHGQECCSQGNSRPLKACEPVEAPGREEPVPGVRSLQRLYALPGRHLLTIRLSQLSLGITGLDEGEPQAKDRHRLLQPLRARIR